MYNLT